MIEVIAMAFVLTGMGIYFVKSTDLPKDLLTRRQEYKEVENLTKNKFNFEMKKMSQEVVKKNSSVDVADLQKKLDQLKLKLAKNMDEQLLMKNEIRDLEDKLRTA